jgi:uncharacterized protein YcbX
MAVGAVVGVVAGLWRHPVKSMQGEALDEATLTTAGLSGDRAWAVVDPATGEALSAKREARLLLASARTAGTTVVVTLPDGSEAAAGDPDLDAAVSAWLGRPLEVRTADPARPTTFAVPASTSEAAPLVQVPNPPGTFFDLAPLHLLSTASVAAMVPHHPDGRWDVARFRPTVLVAASGAGFVEDGWLGSTLAVGDARARVVRPTSRCTMVTKAQPGLPRDLAIATAVNAHHHADLGVYAWVDAPGTVAVGDPVTLT